MIAVATENSDFISDKITLEFLRLMEKK